MPRTTTRPKRDTKAQRGLSVKISPESYGRIEAMKDRFPSLSFDACVRVALNAWDACGETVKNDCVLGAIQSPKS